MILPNPCRGDNTDWLTGLPVCILRWCAMATLRLPADHLRLGAFADRLEHHEQIVAPASRSGDAGAPIEAGAINAARSGAEGRVDRPPSPASINRDAGYACYACQQSAPEPEA
jgi:hypothetical protein